MLRIAGLIALLMTLTSHGYAYDSSAKAAFVLHPATNTVVANHHGDEQLPPASLAKLMTLYALFTALDNNVLTLESELPISKKAWKMGGSKMFLEVDKTVKVEDLIHGIIVSSGNDACIVVAEHLAGTEEAFAEMMNRYAQKIGMNNTVFKNASGWPVEGQVTTAHDMALLAEALIEEFPQYYSNFSSTEFTYNDIRQTNRNRLLNRQVGVDGLKTGHTEEAGFHLVASGTDRGERLISVVMGTTSFSQREGEALKALRYGFNHYHLVEVMNKYQTIEADAPVWMGQKKTIKLVAANAVTAYLPKNQAQDVHVTVQYDAPLVAPLEAGQEVGTITIHLPEQELTTPLLAGEGTPKLNGLARVWRGILYQIGL